MKKNKVQISFDNQKDSIKMCTSVDKRFLQYLPTMVNSVLKNTSSNLELFLLSRDLDEKDEKNILNFNFSNLKIRIIKMENFFIDMDFLLPKHIRSKSAMDRLLITSILENIKKIIYLDVDLVVNADISILNNFDTGEKGICARVCNRGEYDNIRGLIKVWGKNDFNIIKSFPDSVDIENNRCFNSGVMLLDLDKMRANNFQEKMLKMIELYPLADQFLLNLYTNGKHTDLPISWNYFPSQDQNKNNIEKKIIHWVGPDKPWNSFPLFYNEWYRYYLGSKFLLRIEIIIIVITNRIKFIFDKNLGLLGIFLRKKIKRLYFFFSRIKLYFSK